MKISLRQTGGVFGGDRSVDLDETDLSVTERGHPVARRTLSTSDTERVDQLARRLIAKAPSPDAGDLAGASDMAGVSDSMVTEVEIGDADQKRLYRVRSGDDAPDELWELVGTLSEVAEPPPPERP